MESPLFTPIIEVSLNKNKKLKINSKSDNSAPIQVCPIGVSDNLNLIQSERFEDAGLTANQQVKREQRK